MKSRLSSSQGFITADFLFGLVFALSFCTMLAVVCLVLSVVEVSQYVAYSASRAQVAGHVDKGTQVQMAMGKVTKLTSGGMFTNGWFTLKSPEVTSNETDQDMFQEYPYSDNRTPQSGVRLTFTANILNFKLGPLGASSKDGDKSFSSKIVGLMFREPSQQECENYMAAGSRYSKILSLDSRFGILDKGAAGNTKYIPGEDNGC